MLAGQIELMREEGDGFFMERGGVEQDLFNGFFSVVIPDGFYIVQRSAIHNARNDELPVFFRINLQGINIPKEGGGQLFNESIPVHSRES